MEVRWTSLPQETMQDGRKREEEEEEKVTKLGRDFATSAY